MRVREQGVGETLACGTGHLRGGPERREFGLTGSALWVHQPGGTARAALQGDQATLIGSTTFVGELEVPATTGVVT